MKTIEYVRLPSFLFPCSVADLRKAEAKKRRLENAGYTLIHSSSTLLTYRLENQTKKKRKKTA